MLDIHSHILPAIDDGAGSLESSAALLEQLNSQGVTVVTATPHFFPISANLEDFLRRRELSLKALTEFVGENYPVKILLGAEVLYFGGIGSFDGVKQLTISGSKYLLLELLGLKTIDSRVIKDITDLKEKLGITPIIAHVERYRKYNGYKKLMSLFISGAALCQINAGALFSKYDRREAAKLIKRGLVSFIASDCHDPVLRPVRLTAALDEAAKISLVATERILSVTNDIEKELITIVEEQNG